MKAVDERGITPVGLAMWMPWISLVAVWILWGSTYIGIRYAVKTIPPLLMSGSRYLVAGVILLFLVTLVRRRLPTCSLTQLRSTAIAGVCLLLGGNGLLSIGEIHLQSGIAALLVATVPLIMILETAILRRTGIPMRSALALTFGTAGVIVVVGGPGMHVNVGSALTVLVGAFFWASGSVYLANGDMPPNPILATGLEMTIGGAVMVLAGMAIGELNGFSLSAVSEPSALGWFWLLIPGSLIGFTAYSYVLRSLPTNIVATYAYINPVVAVAIGSLLGDQPLTFALLIGGTAVVAAVAVTLVNRQQATDPALESDDALEVA